MTRPQTQLPTHVFSEHAIRGQRLFHTEPTTDNGRDWQSPSLGKTQYRIDGDESVRLQQPESAATLLIGVPAPQATLRNMLAGNILERQDQMFMCEVIAGGRSLDIALSVDLFDWSAHAGDAFELSMVEQDGIRQPRVSRRSPDLQTGADLRAEIARIAASMR